MSYGPFQAKTIKDVKQQEQAKEKVKEMMHEARLMRYFDHENVVKIHGVALCSEPLMIVIEMVLQFSNQRILILEKFPKHIPVQNKFRLLKKKCKIS